MNARAQINLVGIFADKLNLNGDQANLFVLQKRLQWLGITAEIINVTTAKELAQAKADFILLGHGSIAAWQFCDREWPSLAQDFISATKYVRGLAVGSAAAKVSRAAGSQLRSLAHPVSQFAVEKALDLEVLGYKYADVEPAETFGLGKAIVTWLHGPLLAKNPVLADAIISELLQAKGIAVPTLENENTRKVERLVAGVWQLEKPEH